MKEKYFKDFLEYIKQKKIFPNSLIDDSVWQKNTEIFLSVFERFLKTEEGRVYLKDIQEGKITIVEGNTIPVTDSNCPECVKQEDITPVKNTVKKVNPFEQILRGEYRK